MNENSTLRYLGEAYEGVGFHLEPLWSALDSDVALRVYLAGAAAAFTIYSVFFIFSSVRDMAAAMRSSVRRT